MSIRQLGKCVSGFLFTVLCAASAFATPPSGSSQVQTSATTASVPSSQCYMDQTTSELKNALAEANRSATPVEPSGKVCKVCEVEEYSGPPPRTVVFCYAVPCR